jgi:hypothetical protein
MKRMAWEITKGNYDFFTFNLPLTLRAKIFPNQSYDAKNYWYANMEQHTCNVKKKLRIKMSMKICINLISAMLNIHRFHIVKSI